MKVARYILVSQMS